MKSSPWGPIQHTKVIAEGIVQVSTASHGGYHCTGVAQRAIENALPGFIPFAGHGWYEEDEDWAIVALVHATWFDDAAVESAVRTVMHDRFPARPYEAVLTWLQGDSREALAVRLRVVAYAEAHAEQYEVVSWGSPPSGYAPGTARVGFRHRTTRDHRTAIFADYPTQRLYTLEEIITLDLTRGA